MIKNFVMWQYVKYVKNCNIARAIQYRFSYIMSPQSSEEGIKKAEPYRCQN